MDQIHHFEAFLLPQGVTLYHVQRRGIATLSLPASREGASHAFGLYQPQLRLAQIKTWVLHALISRGLHPWVLQKSLTKGTASFSKWDFEYSPATVGILLGSSEHLIPRAIASFCGADGWEVAKLGLGEVARNMLHQEAAVLRDLADVNPHVPRCLGLHTQGDMTILRMSYLAGKTLSVGDSSEALEVLHQWIGNEPPQAVNEFEEWKSIQTALEGTTDGREVLESLSCLTLRPVLAHGDFARWNLLRQVDGLLIALDWEWGARHGMPGLDLAHYFTQDARLVKQLNSQEAIRVIEAELNKPQAQAYLKQTGWMDHPIAPILACAAYKQGAKHQNNSAFLDACVKEYLAQIRNPVKDAGALRQPPQINSASNISKSAQPVRESCACKQASSVRISVVTPSYKQISYLKCAAASVQDQSGNFQVEHLIHDGGSGAEFDQWAESQHGAVCISEPDGGMYDAINRGFRKAKGEIIAWLNCDEQYLPGALEKVSQFFEAHPETDILFGDIILVDELMSPLAYRRAVKPTLGHIRHSHLSTFSAATFVRRRVIDEGHLLRCQWKTIADAVWIDELLAAGYQAKTLHEPLAVFCMLGSNLGQSSLLFRERRNWENQLAATSVWKKRWYIFQYRFERLRVGAYWIRRCKISAYLPGSLQRIKRTSWVSGQWSLAKNQAANLKSKRDGSLGDVAKGPWRTRWAIGHAFCVLILVFSMNRLIVDDAVKAPSILLLSLLFLSFRSKLRDLIPIAILYFFVVIHSLSQQALDVFIVRLLSFSLGAILAVFWSATLRNLEEWIRSTVALIRKIPVPIILTEKTGDILLANNAAYTHLKMSQEDLHSQTLHPFKIESDEGLGDSIRIEEWAERPPEGVLSVSLAENTQTPIAKARVFVVGKGNYQFYAFMLKD